MTQADFSGTWAFRRFTLSATLRTAVGVRPVRMTTSSNDFNEGAISIKLRSSAYDHRLI